MCAEACCAQRGRKRSKKALNELIEKWNEKWKEKGIEIVGRWHPDRDEGEDMPDEDSWGEYQFVCIKLPQPPASFFAQQQQALNGELSKLREEFEMKALSIAHPDWQQQLNTPEFTEWQTTLRPEDQQRLGSTWDSQELSQAFTKFKDWKTKKAEFERNKQTTLEGNIPIKSNGGGRQQNTYNNDYERGFNEGLRGN
jgi:hypothetical protein